MNKNTLIMILLIFISGCSSVSPPIHYYLLSQDLGPTVNIDKSKLSVYLKSVTLADYLNQSALVMMVDNQQAKIANYHFWVERLDKAVSNVISHDLEAACSCRVLDHQLADSQPKDAIALSLHIEQMASSSNGQVLLAGRFRTFQNNKQLIHRFRYAKAMDGKGFSSAIAVKRELISYLAKDISEKLNH